MPQIVYVLTNEAMPSLVKIGTTSRDDVTKRITELSASTGVPLPFDCHYAGEVADDIDVEDILHRLFSEYRINPKREFFRVSPEKVVLGLNLARAKDVTPGRDGAIEVPEIDKDEADAINAERSRRNRIDLSCLGISKGTVLILSRGNNITCEVTDNNKVLYSGKVTSMSDAARSALSELGYKSKAVSGPNYWMLNGRTIDEIRVQHETFPIIEELSNDS